MTQGEAVFLTLVSIVLIFSFVLLLVLGLSRYKNKNNERFSFLSFFPFELVGEKEKSSPLLRSLAVTYAIADAVVYAYPFMGAERFLFAQPLAIVALAVSFVKDIFMVLLFFVPAHHFKPHLFSFLFFGCLNALQGVVIGSYLLSLNPMNQVAATSFAILFFLFGVLTMVALLNPHLARWTEMNLEVAEDGSMNPVRPRPFVLAFTEWLLIFFALTSSIVYLIGITTIILG